MLSGMRLLGIDYGTKRVGVALSDERGVMAFPYDTFANDRTLLSRIAALAAEQKVGAVVVGQSLALDGTPNAVEEKVERFVVDLTEQLDVPIHRVPEQFSTQAALRLQGRTAQTDASAAALILDAYITMQTKHGELR